MAIDKLQKKYQQMYGDEEEAPESSEQASSGTEEFLGHLRKLSEAFQGGVNKASDYLAGNLLGGAGDIPARASGEGDYKEPAQRPQLPPQSGEQVPPPPAESPKQAAPTTAETGASPAASKGSTAPTKASDPTKEMKRTLDALKGELSDIPKDRSDEFKDRFAQLDNEYKQILADYKSDTDTAKRNQLLSQLANGITQMFAGAYGIKHNVDMSSITGSQYDWRQEFDTALNKAKLARENVSEKRGVLEKEQGAYEGERRQAMRDRDQFTRSVAADLTKMSIADKMAAAREAASDKRMGERERVERLKLYANSLNDDAKAYDRLALQFDRAKEYTPEEAQQIAANVPGISPDFVADKKTWFGLGAGKVSGAQIASRIMSQGLEARKVARQFLGGDSGPAAGAPTPQGMQMQPDGTGILNGAKYKRVQGGWQKIQ